MGPLVSVILTAHNYGRFLKQSIESVLAQTWQDFELVIVNDGSSDNTEEVLAPYARDPRVIILTLAGVGLAAASNRGIHQSRGTYIMRLDADDFLDPHALSVEAGFLARHPKADLVYPDFYTVDEQGRFLGYTRVPRVQDGARLLDSNPLAGGALYRRSCYDSIGGYDETLRYQEDFDFWLRFTERFRAYGVGLPLLSYRQHAGSMSKNRANRSAARRHVKRQFARERNLLAGEEVLVVIPTAWPGAPGRIVEFLSRPLGTTTPLELTIEQAITSVASLGCRSRVVVASDRVEIKSRAQSTRVEVVPAPVFEPSSSERAEVVWLRVFIQNWQASGQPMPSLAVLVSPYCPYRHHERLREILDTLAIHGCDIVLSMDSEPVTPWTAEPSGIEQIGAHATSSGSKVLREAGELLAMRVGWLREGRLLGQSLVGYVELMFPEWWCLKDEAAWMQADGMLTEGATIHVQPKAYLQGEG